MGFRTSAKMCRTRITTHLQLPRHSLALRPWILKHFPCPSLKKAIGFAPFAFQTSSAAFNRRYTSPSLELLGNLKRGPLFLDKTTSRRHWRCSNQAQAEQTKNDRESSKEPGNNKKGAIEKTAGTAASLWPPLSFSSFQFEQLNPHKAAV